jgi:hypothetical protein
VVRLDRRTGSGLAGFEAFGMLDLGGLVSPRIDHVQVPACRRMVDPERPDCFLGNHDGHGGGERGESFRVRFNLVEEYLVPSCWSGP